MLALRFIEVFAHAYDEEWSDFHQDREMLERIVAAFDFYCRAQGNSGGFMGPPLPGTDVNWPTWLGGPVRSDFSPGLEVGQRFFWDGFSRVLPDLDKGGFLETSTAGGGVTAGRTCPAFTSEISRCDAPVADIKPATSTFCIQNRSHGGIVCAPPCVASSESNGFCGVELPGAR